jgi:hypothetical protein
MYSKVIVAAMGVLLLGTLAVPRARASQGNQAVIFKVKQAFEIPGRALPPGTYELRIAHFGSPIAELCSAHCTHFYGFVSTDPVIRRHHVGRTSVKFVKSVPGAPERIEEWFTSGHATGHELLYPAAHPQYLANSSNKAGKKNVG